MAVSVVWTDLLNGGGYSATVFGSPGQQYVVYCQRVDGTFAANPWLILGQVGDAETLAGTLAPGRYFVYANRVGSAELSTINYVAVTSGVVNLHQSLLDGAEAVIGLLALDGIEDVQQLKWPVDGMISCPAIILTVMNDQENVPDDGSVGTDRTEFPVTLMIVTTNLSDNDRDAAAGQRQLLYWREKLRRAFRSQRLAGVPLQLYCKVEPGPIVAADATKKDYQISSMTLRYLCREPRGMGV
jgi:hypothetical protein